MGIRRLACFDQLPNLQWLCLDNNTVNNIEVNNNNVNNIEVNNNNVNIEVC